MEVAGGARTHSIFLLHPFVAFWLFQAVPVTSWIGPLERFSTYAAVCGLVLPITCGLAWVQDIGLEKAISMIQQPTLWRLGIWASWQAKWMQRPAGQAAAAA